MVSRVTTTSTYTQLVADMQQSLSNYNKVTEQLASGNKLTSITDDPIAAVNILNTNRQLTQIETFTSNVEMAMSELSTMDDLLDLASGYLSTAWDKAIQANNQTYGQSSLEALKVEIDELTKTMVDLANTEYNDNYIFSGANTKTVTYTIDDNGDIIYNGTPADNPDYVRQTEVADGVYEVINTTGDTVFGYYRAAVEAGNGVYTDADGNRVYETTDDDGNTIYTYENGTEYTGDVDDLTDGAEEESSGVMGALKQLSNALQKVIDGLEAGDDDLVQEGYDEMNATLDMFSDSLDTITTVQTKFGGVYNRLEMSESTLETTSTNLTSYLSELQDVDITTAITEWYEAQYAYQATLQVTSATVGMSLLDYI